MAIKTGVNAIIEQTSKARYPFTVNSIQRYHII